MPLDNQKNPRDEKRRLLARIRRRARLLYLKILRIEDPPERIARGAAIGVFMGIVPTFGLGAVFAIAFSFILRANKAASVIGSMIMNPLTTPFFWTLSIMAGSVVLGQDSSEIIQRVKNEGMVKGVGLAYMVFLFGNIMVALVSSLAAYLGVKAAIVRHRRRKAMKAAKTP
jgi:uncharacterized protein (TIGR03546 family)